jgi:translation initiation factor 1A
MPKNKGKGGKKHKRGKNQVREVRELLLKEDQQEYAVAEKMLGDGRIKMQCGDGKNRIGIIRGKMRKRVWIQAGDLVLIGLRSFQDGKADVIHKYAPEEARKLKKMGEVPDTMRNREEETEDIPNDEESAFIFEDI